MKPHDCALNHGAEVCDYVPEARLFWVVTSPDDDVTPEIFQAKHEAYEYARRFGKSAPYRIGISEVRNFFQEADGSWNYEDYSDTFTDVITIVTQTDTRDKISETYRWLCSYCMEELAGVDPDMDWPKFHPGTCERCKREVVVFATQEQ